MFLSAPFGVRPYLSPVAHVQLDVQAAPPPVYADLQRLLAALRAAQVAAPERLALRAARLATLAALATRPGGCRGPGGRHDPETATMDDIQPGRRVVDPLVVWTAWSLVCPRPASPSLGRTAGTAEGLALARLAAVAGPGATTVRAAMVQAPVPVTVPGASPAPSSGRYGLCWGDGVWM